MKMQGIEINDGKPVGNLALFAQHGFGGSYGFGGDYSTARARLVLTLRKTHGRLADIIRWEFIDYDSGEVMAEGEGPPPVHLIPPNVSVYGTFLGAQGSRADRRLR